MNLKKCLFFGCILYIILSIVFPELIISSWMALILGIIFAIILGNPYDGKTSNITSNLLKISVVGIGFGYPVSSVAELSFYEFSYVLVFIILTFFTGYVLGKFTNVERKTADLINSGTAICGASAIAAISSTIRANEKQISISLGTVFILSVSGLIIYPLIGDYLSLSERQFGLWAGLTVHDTASAIGAAQDFGANSLKIATIIKLAKVLFIIPIVFIGSVLYKNNNNKFTFPYFIVFFLFAMILNSILPNYTGFEFIKEVGKKGLQVSLFLIGANLSIKNLKSIGIKPLIHGLVLWCFLSTISLITIMYFSY